ncbi:S9 family peptidase [Tamlana haliotis]|uniref:S9 family peptidase n=1 Tax=Pseudotamlana haliotis TaxID=2614804 RepID=A0A6N6MFM4_9FLAO|nr:prolyl oligopeptidase family serine peptidase [Tamlana haliotis]KAB1068156.1 S9 family peptidase [Tamlana haliotis]
MLKSSFLKQLVAVVITVFINSHSNIFAQEIKKDSINLVKPSDYGQWERLSNVIISGNGEWVTYKTTTNDQDNSTYIYNTKNKSSIVFPNTSKAVFSNDANWISLSKVLPGKEAKKRLKSKKKDADKDKASLKSIIYNLKTKDTLELEGYQSISFSDVGSYIAMKRSEGDVLIVKNLNSKNEVTFGNVKSYNWQSDNAIIAMIIETKDKVGNAIQTYNPNTGVLRVLDQENTTYSNMLWLKDSDDLFVMRTFEDDDYIDETHHLLLWKDLNSKKTSSHIFNQSKFENFPKDTRLLSNRVRVSEDANSIYFTTFSWENKSKKIEETEKKKDSLITGASKEEAPEVEIWNSKDLVIISAQKKSKMGDIEQPLSAVWHINENKFVPLADDLVEKIQVQIDNEVVLGLDRTPYDFEAIFGRPSYDVYTVNSKTGAKLKVLENITRAWGVSPNNKYFTYLKDNDIHLFNISKGTSKNITQGLNGTFINFENDHPLPQKAAFGFNRWNKDSKSFFVYSEFNVWQFFTNGAAPKKITNGEKEGVVYRIINFDSEQIETDASKTVYFSLKGKYTKNTGFAKGIPGKEIKRLVYDNFDISLASLKLKNSDNILFVKQSYQDSPNLYLTNTEFKFPVKLSNTNAFQNNFAWGKAELIEYKNAVGKNAQGILYYPANYVKGKKYPMITYVYEKLSNRLHRYIAPSKYDYYNTTVWSQNGYFVLNPDIHFIAGEPGTSSTTTLENAVNVVVDKGDVDASKVGLIGHSWGGYQAGFVPTQTNIFAASVAGAGLTDLVAMNLAITPAFGGRPENDHFEVGQERMNSAPWVSPDNYFRNSSIMQIENLNTPMLFEVGDNDTNVNWSQGLAYYNAARRAGKPFVLLVYANEGHGLRQEKNRFDYQTRILKWFGHYLKEDKAEDWITEGIPYKEQQRRLENWKD